MTPAYEIKANGEVITPKIQGKLLDLTIIDEAGRRSDQLSLAVEDSARTIALPGRGAVLEVSLGYVGALRKMGKWVVDEFEIQGPPDVLTIRATAAPMISTAAASGLQTQKSRSWAPGQLGYMVRSIAQEHGLKAEISAQVAATALPHVGQTDESDMNMLTRLTAERDLLFKLADGRLIVLSMAEALTARSTPVAPVFLRIGQVSTWSFRAQARFRYGQVVTRWHNPDTGQPVEETAGREYPVFRASQTYANQQTAQAAANAMLRNYHRQGVEATLTMRGRTDIIAEQRMWLNGFRKEFDSGEWKIVRVEHHIGRQGFNTVVSAIAAAEILPPAAKPIAEDE